MATVTEHYAAHLAPVYEWLAGMGPVPDLLYERRAGQWTASVSAYPKLRMAPAWVCSVLESCGLSVQQGVGPGGMVRIVASRSSE